MSRQFSTPILLPGQPTLDLHAVPKLYVDQAVDLREATDTAYTVALADPTALLGRTTRYNTAGGAINQPLPPALPSRIWRYGWDGGSSPLVFTAAAGDYIGGGSATSITAPSTRGIQTWRCSFTGRWRLIDGYLEQDSLDARYMPKEPGTAFRAINTAVQSIPNATDTPVAFPAVARPSSLVTPSAQGVGHKFTLNRAGVWVGSATVRVAAAASGEAYVALVQSGVGIVSAFNASYGGPSATRHLSIGDWFDAGAALFINLFQSAGSAKDTEPNAGNWCQIKLNWVHD